MSPSYKAAKPTELKKADSISLRRRLSYGILAGPCPLQAPCSFQKWGRPLL